MGHTRALVTWCRTPPQCPSRRTSPTTWATCSQTWHWGVPPRADRWTASTSLPSSSNTVHTTRSSVHPNPHPDWVTCLPYSTTTPTRDPPSLPLHTQPCAPHHGYQHNSSGNEHKLTAQAAPPQVWPQNDAIHHDSTLRTCTHTILQRAQLPHAWLPAPSYRDYIFLWTQAAAVKVKIATQILCLWTFQHWVILAKDTTYFFA